MIRSAKPKKDTRGARSSHTDPVDAAWGRGFDSAMRGEPVEANPFDPVDQPAEFSEWEAGHRDANH